MACGCISAHMDCIPQFFLISSPYEAAKIVLAAVKGSSIEARWLEVACGCISAHMDCIPQIFLSAVHMKPPELS